MLFVQDASGDVEEKLKLESTVNELQKKLTEEATAKKQITLLLLEDRKKMATLYLEEKKRSEDLNHLLREEKSKVSKWLPHKLLLICHFSCISKISFTPSIDKHLGAFFGYWTRGRKSTISSHGGRT